MNEWLAKVTAEIGVHEELSEEEMDALLKIARIAAHSSDDRRNAPLLTYATGQEGFEQFVVVLGPRDPLWEYIFDARTAGFAMAGLAVPRCCVGHTHVPATFRVGDTKVMINPGSVGQPRDGDPRASYALLDVERGTADFHRVAYDVIETQKRMRALKLPDMLADRLAFGL